MVIFLLLLERKFVDEVVELEYVGVVAANQLCGIGLKHEVDPVGEGCFNLNVHVQVDLTVGANDPPDFERFLVAYGSHDEVGLVLALAAASLVSDQLRRVHEGHDRSDAIG